MELKFMDNTKNDDYYVDKILKYAERIVIRMSNVDYDSFVCNLDVQEAMMFNLVQISENVKRISDNYKLTRINVPWKDMIGLRNKIMHDYGHVVLDVVYDTLKNDIPELVNVLKNEQE